MKGIISRIESSLSFLCVLVSGEPCVWFYYFEENCFLEHFRNKICSNGEEQETFASNFSLLCRCGVINRELEIIKSTTFVISCIEISVSGNLS